MTIRIHPLVQEAFPSLCLHWQSVDMPSSERTQALSVDAFAHLRLTRNDLAMYRKLRRRMAGEKLFAVERLRLLSSPTLLPTSDLLTSFLIQVSYRTRLPVTAFAVDTIDSVELRFSTPSETLQVRKGSLALPVRSVVADSQKGIIGHFGIQSSLVARLDEDTEQAVILSFGCSPSTCQISAQLVQLLAEQLQ